MSKNIVGEVMSNFDHRINQQIAERLMAEPGAEATYAAWNFCGYVRFEDDEWLCEIWQRHQFRALLQAASLEDIMEAACDRFGTG